MSSGQSYCVQPLCAAHLRPAQLGLQAQHLPPSGRHVPLKVAVVLPVAVRLLLLHPIQRRVQRLRLAAQGRLRGGGSGGGGGRLRAQVVQLRAGLLQMRVTYW